MAYLCGFIEVRFGHLHTHFLVRSLLVLKTGGISNSLFPLNNRNDSVFINLYVNDGC